MMWNPLLLTGHINDALLKAIKSGSHAKQNVRKLCMDVAGRMVFEDSPHFMENIALCFLHSEIRSMECSGSPSEHQIMVPGAKMR